MLPDFLCMPKEISQYLSQTSSIHQEKMNSLERALVEYKRIQKERCDSLADYERAAHHVCAHATVDAHGLKENDCHASVASSR